MKIKTTTFLEIERTRIPKSQLSKLNSAIVKSRPDLIPEDQKFIYEYYELADKSILEIFLPEVPKESELTVYNSDNDVISFRLKLAEFSSKLKKYNYKTDYEIIAIKYNELTYLSESNAQILSDSLNIPLNLLDSTKASLKLLDKAFMRTIHPEEKDNNMLFKALIYYLARTIKNEVNGKISINRDGNLVTNMIVIDSKGRTFKAVLDLPEIWTDGPKTTVEIEGCEKKKVMLTMEALFNLEVGKYKHSFPTKPSNISEN